MRLLSNSCECRVAFTYNVPVHVRADYRRCSNRTAQKGDNAPEAADLYFAYGKALLENAISQSSVLGKDQTEDALAADKGAFQTRRVLSMFNSTR